VSEPEAYTPVSCGLYDRLLLLATRGAECRIAYLDDQRRRAELRGRIADVFSRGGAEYLRLESGREIRLDRLVEIDGRPADAGDPR
jgi:Rho-binding antiterminator